MCNQLNLVTTTRLRRRGDAQHERKKLRVQGYTREIADRSGTDQVDRGRSPAMIFASPAMRFTQGWIASEVLRWWLPKGGSRAKFCDDDCPRVDRERSPAMMIASPAMRFTQGWIASKVLRWWLPKGGSLAKFCDGDCPRVDCRMAKGWLRDITKPRQIRDRNNGSFRELRRGNCEGGRVLMTTNGNSQT